MIKQISKTCLRFLALAMVLSSCVTGQIGTPIPITPEPFEAHAVLAYGKGWTSTDWTNGEAFVFLALPELTVYDNGLVLFSCRQEAWPEICQRQISLERIGRLWDELDATGVFTHSHYETYKNERLGPRTYFTLETRRDPITPAISIQWSSASNNEALAMQAVLDAFIKEITPSNSRQTYQPKYASLWITLRDKCPTGQPIDCDTPWPFKFSSKVTIPVIISYDKNCSMAEVPQSIAEIRSAIPDFDKHPLGEGHFFRDGNSIVEVQIRPYLPGERMLTQCAWSRQGYEIEYRYYLYFLN